MRNACFVIEIRPGQWQVVYAMARRREEQDPGVAAVSGSPYILIVEHSEWPVSMPPSAREA